MDLSSRQIKLGSIISYITIVFSIISGLIYTPWLISVIGQADFGLYTLATSLITMVTIDLGLSSAVTRFVSKYRAENNTEAIQRFMSIVYKLYIALASVFLVLLTLVYFNVDLIFLKLSQAEVEKVKFLLAIAGLYAVISFPFQPLDGLLFSGEWFVFHKTTMLISKILNIILMVAALLLGYGLFALVIVNAIVGIVIIGMKLFFLKRNDWYSVAWKSFDKTLAKEIFAFSMWVMVISIAQRMILNVTPSILGMTSGSKEIAMFSASMTIEGYIWTFATVLGGMFLPKVSKMIYSENAGPAEIQELMIKVGRIQFLLLGVIVSVFIVEGRHFFINWLGPDFEKSYLITIFLILPGLVTIPQEIAATTLVATNRVKYSAYSRISIALVAIVLSYLLSMKLGAVGAGIGIFIGNIIGGVIILNIIYAKVLKIQIWNFFLRCQISMGAPLVIVIIAGIVLNTYFLEISWSNTILKVFILGVLYAIAAYYMAINRFEKQLIQSMFKTIIRK